MPDHDACQAILTTTIETLTAHTHALGNTALGFVIGHAEYKRLQAAQDAAVLAGDLDQTKQHGRALIRWVREVVTG